MKGAHMFKNSVWVAAAVVLGGAVAAQAAIVEHVGSNDPTTEGFTYETASNGTVTTGAVINDGGVDAWKVDDNATNDYGLYYQGFSSADQASLLAQGFTATMKLRIADTPSDAPGGAVAFDLNLGSTHKRFLVYFGTNADGDPNFYFNDGNFSYPVATGAGGGYHTFKLIYDPVTTTADVYLDATQLKDDWAGLSGSTQRGQTFGQAVFGSGSGGDTGQGNYASFVVAVPEPASVALMGLGVVALVGRRRR